MESAPLSLPWPARLSSLLDRAWARGLAHRPSLEPGAILAAASRREGGRPAPGAWHDRLALLCTALETEARLNSLGRTIAYGQLVRIVASRIRAERWLARYSDIRFRPVAAPIVLVGQMRSGTTRAHRLLACDPAFAHIRLFETLEPIAFGRGIDRREGSAMAALALIKLCNPALTTIHPSSVRAPEEDFGLHAFGLWGAQFEGQWSIPSFVAHGEHAEGEEVRGVYREMKILLQLIGAVRKTDVARPWLLKAPQYCQDLDALLAVFPDARVIRLDRAPDRVVGSGASLAWNQMRIQSDRADRAAIGTEWLRKTVVREQKLEEALDRGVAHLTVEYDEVSRDWRGAMVRVYAFLGRILSPDVEARMARFVERSTAHHGHHYALEDFGLDERRVAAALV